MHSYPLGLDAIFAGKIVLILVLMEDALVQGGLTYIPLSNECLNPCFNGRCTRTFNLLDFNRLAVKS